MTDAIGWAGLAATALSLAYSVRVARMLNGYSHGLWAFPLAFALALLRRAMAMASMHGAPDWVAYAERVAIPALLAVALLVGIREVYYRARMQVLAARIAATVIDEYRARERGE